MSMETWSKDWKTTEEDEQRHKNKIKAEQLDKLIDRIKDIIKAYDDEKYEGIIKDLKWEVECVEEEIA